MAPKDRQEKAARHSPSSAPRQGLWELLAAPQCGRTENGGWEAQGTSWHWAPTQPHLGDLPRTVTWVSYSGRGRRRPSWMGQQQRCLEGVGPTSSSAGIWQPQPGVSLQLLRPGDGSSPG